MRVGTFVYVAALAASTPAFADLTEPQQQIERDLREFQNAVEDAKEWGNRKLDELKKTPEDCLALVEKGKQAGIAPTEVMSGNPEKYLFKRAPEKCEEYGRWQLLVQAADAISDGQKALFVAQNMQAGSITGQVAKQWGDRGMKCLDTVDAALKKGASATQPIKVDGTAMTLPDGRAKYCQAVVDWAAKFTVETDKVRAEAAAKIRQKYSKEGITGDRLKVLADHDGNSWYLVKCDRAVENPKELKKPGVLFHWTELSKGGYGIRRFEFSGDKLVKDTYREFDRRDSAYAWCK